MLGITLLLAWTAAAEDRYAVLPASALKLMSVEQLLEQEVVSVSRRTEPWGRAASSVFVLRGESARYVAATSLPELLRLVPQLFVARATSSDWAINTRGFVRDNATANKLLVLVDGRTVYSPFFSNVFWDVQDVFLPDLDRIETISGPAGVTWGSNAVNGVINILTRRAQDTVGTVILAAAGTEERAHFGVRHGLRFGENGAVRFYAQRREVDATLGPGGEEDGFDGFVFAQTGFRADWGTALTVQGDAYRTRRDAGAAPPIRAEGGNLLTRWSRDLTGDSHLMVRLYHDYSMRDLQQAYVARTNVSDLEFQHRFRLGDRQQFLWGGNYRLLRDHVAQTSAGFAILPAKLDFALAGLFAQHDWPFAADAFQLTSGVRLENNEFSGWEWQPSLRLVWRPAQWSTTWIRGSRTTRTPSRLEQGFHAPRDAPYAIAGGPDIDSEVLDAVEIGGRWQLGPAVSITTSVFHHEYDKLRSVELSQPIVQANGVAGRSTGTELFVDWDVTPGWRLRAGGFYVDQDTWVKRGHTDADHAMGEASFPKYQFQVRSTLWLTDTVSFWTALRHVDEVPAYDNGRDFPVPAYTELDATVTWRINPQVEVSVIGRNLLDASHPEIGLPSTRREIERSVQGIVRCRF